METIEFEYFVTQRATYLNNELTQEFFDPYLPIDKQVSKGKKSQFSGYQVMQTHHMHKSFDSKEIPHKDKPTFRQITEQRSNFSSFFNQQFKDRSFYDFSDQTLEAHKRSICFLGLQYEKEGNSQHAYKFSFIKQSESY